MTAAFNLSQLANNLNTSGQLDATDGLSGAVPIANGGTGQTTASAAINALLPSQTGNSGRFLTTNGTAASWANVVSKVVQVVVATKTDQQTTTSTSFVDVPGLSVSITPVYSTSKLLIFVNVMGSSQAMSGMIVTDGSNNIIQPAGSPYGPSNYSAHGSVTFDFGDQNAVSTAGIQLYESSAVGTTSTVVRKVRVRAELSTKNVSINKGVNPLTTAPFPSPISTISVWEIAQ